MSFKPYSKDEVISLIEDDIQEAEKTLAETDDYDVETQMFYTSQGYQRCLAYVKRMD